MYPKVFFDRFQALPEPGKCFVVMPFAPKFDAVFRSIRSVIVEDLRLTCVRSDELLGGGNIIEDILRSLATSELVIVDLTGRNPNVFYELGIAHMCKPVEKVILLSQEIASIPFDLRPFRNIVYKPSAEGLRKMRTALRNAVSAVGERIHRFDLNEHNKGKLPDKLMGKDRCLYEFEVNQAAVADGAAKVSLTVTRYVMGVGHGRQNGSHATLRSARAFNGGLGLRLGEPTSIDGTEWSILLERAYDGKLWFRIMQTKAAVPRATQAGTPSTVKRARTPPR